MILLKLSILSFLAFSKSYVESTALTSNMPNVCSKQTRNVYSMMVREEYWTSYTTTTRCGWLGWSRCDKTLYEKKQRYITRYALRYSTYYTCCSGWKKSSYGCQTAICTPSCWHGRGHCILPNTCRCHSGYEGPSTGCNRDINECLINNGGCDQNCHNYPGGYSCSCRRGFYPSNGRNCRDINECSLSSRICRCNDPSNNPQCIATCQNTVGSYRCTCSRGYRLIGSFGCTDINECSIDNGGCSHICENTGGSYRCSCPLGYQMNSNGKSCSDIDECLTNNGGCAHSCINNVGSFTCQCRPGHVLDYNGKTCSDFNECLSNRHGCQHKCNNYKGGYFCACDKGYRLNADNRTCSDIDECKGVKPGTNIKLSMCTQNCHNVEGSYNCSCRTGYRLAYDGRTCTDVNECKVGTDKCQHTCMNTLGSYICRCLRGYRLNPDGRACDAMPCMRHPPVINGRGTCFFGKTNETCSFSCIPGFDFRGSKMRRCQANHTWDGSLPTCSRKHCSQLSPPANGGISLPCFKYYQASCSIKCKHGYYATGPTERSCRVSGNNTMYWSNPTISCQEISICAPNPCKHKGVCVAKNKDQFECDCHNTGYQGQKCEEGIVTLQVPPNIQLGKVYTLTVEARPDNDLTVEMTTNDKSLIVNPSTIRFNSSVTVAVVELHSNHAGGMKVLSYKLEGTDASVFVQPRNQIIYVQNSFSRYDKVISDIGALSKGCHIKQIDASDKKNDKVNVFSTAPWKDQRDKESTDGIILLDIQGTVLPASLVGSSIVAKALEFGKMDNFVAHTWPDINDADLAISVKDGACISEGPSSRYLPTIVNINAFFKSVADGINELTPSWFRIIPEVTMTSFDPNGLEGSLISGFKVKSQYQICGEIVNIVDDERMYYAYTASQKVSIRLWDEDIDSSAKGPFCVIKSVHKNDTIISFADPLTQSKTLQLATGWAMQIKGIYFTNRNGAQLYHIFGNFSTMLTSRMATFEIKFDGDMKISVENDSKFIENGIMEVKALSGRGVISLKRIETKTAVEEFFVGNGTIRKKILDAEPTYRQVSIFLNHTEDGSSCQLVNGNVHLSKNSKLTYEMTVRDSDGQIKSIQNKTQSYNIYKEMQLMKKKIELALEETSSQHPELSSLTSSIASNLDKAELKARDVSMFTNQSMGSSVLQPLFVLKNLINTIGRQLQVLSLKHQQKNSSKIEMNYINEYEKSVNQLKQSWKTPLERVNTSRQIISRSITTEGTICFEKLCFGKSSLEIIFDMRSTALKERFGVKVNEGTFKAVIGKVNKEMVLGGLVTIPKDGIVLQVINKSGLKQGFFNASMNFYGNTFTTTVRYTSGRLEFSTTIFLPDGSKSSIEAQSDITKVLNENEIVFEVKGTNSNDTCLIMNINSLLHEKLLKISEYVAARISTLKKTVNISEHQLNVSEQNLLITNEVYKTKQASLTNLKKSIAAANARFIKLKQELVSRIQEHDKKVQNYTEAIENCTPRLCLQKCVPGLITGICYEERYDYVLVKECEEVKETILEKETRTVYTKVKFEIYEEIKICDVSCPPLTRFFKSIFGKRKRRELMQVSDATTAGLVRKRRGIGTVLVGAAASAVVSEVGGELFRKLGGKSGELGARIGALLPGPLSVVGMVVGGIIGSAFGSCDEGCRIERCVIEKTVKTVKTITVTRTATYTKTVCKDVPVKRKLGYKEGHECVHWSNCSATKLDEDCMRKNKACYEQRIRLKEKIRNIPSLKPEFDEYEKLSLQLEALGIKQEKATRAKSNAYQNVLAAKATHSKANYTYAMSKIALANANTILSNEIRIAKLVELMGKDVITVGIGEFSYHLSRGVTAPRAIYLSMNVIWKGKKSSQIRSIFDFDNVDVSISDIVKKLMSLSFSSSVKETVEESRKRKCKEIERDVLYVMKVADFIQNSTKKFIEAHKKIADAEMAENNYTQSTISVIKAIDICSNDETGVSCTNDWLNGLYVEKTEKDEVKEAVVWPNERADMFANIQRFTSHQNFTQCNGTIDCIELSIKSIFDAVKYENSNFSNIAREHISVLNPYFTQIFENSSIGANQTYALTERILSSIQLSMVRYLFCGNPPLIVKDLPSMMIITSKAKTTLSVTIDSTIHEVSYKWFKDGEEIQSAKSNPLELDDISMATSGHYHCEISNKFGKVTSNVLEIVYHESPKIVTHPKGLKTTLKSPDATITLMCNATGQPIPSTSWVFTPFNDTSIILNLQGNESLFRTKATSTGQSGFYRCKATNSQGTDSSKNARVHVREPLIAEFGIEIWFVVALNDSHAGSKAIVDTSKLKSIFSKQMGIPAERISNVIYENRNKDRSEISFEIASHNLNSILANHSDWNEISEDVVLARKGLLVLPIALYYSYKNGSSLLDIGGIKSEVLAETMDCSLKEAQCPVGYSLNPNGFICESCPAGTYYNFAGRPMENIEKTAFIQPGTCEPCPMGTYQSEQKKLECVPCPVGYTTEFKGAVYSGDCIKTGHMPSTKATHRSTKQGMTTKSPAKSSKQPVVMRAKSTFVKDNIDVIIAAPVMFLGLALVITLIFKRYRCRKFVKVEPLKKEPIVVVQTSEKRPNAFKPPVAKGVLFSKQDGKDTLFQTKII